MTNDFIALVLELAKPDWAVHVGSHAAWTAEEQFLLGSGVLIRSGKLFSEKESPAGPERD